MSGSATWRKPPAQLVVRADWGGFGVNMTWAGLGRQVGQTLGQVAGAAAQLADPQLAPRTYDFGDLTQ